MQQPTLETYKTTLGGKTFDKYIGTLISNREGRKSRAYVSKRSIALKFKLTPNGSHRYTNYFISSASADGDQKRSTSLFLQGNENMSLNLAALICHPQCSL